MLGNVAVADLAAEESSIRRFERGDTQKVRGGVAGGGNRGGREMAGKKRGELNASRGERDAKPPRITTSDGSRNDTDSALLSSRYRHMVVRARPRRFGRSRSRSVAFGRTSARPVVRESSTVQRGG